MVTQLKGKYQNIKSYIETTAQIRINRPCTKVKTHAPVPLKILRKLLKLYKIYMCLSGETYDGNKSRGKNATSHQFNQSSTAHAQYTAI